MHQQPSDISVTGFSPATLLRLTAVEGRVALSKATIYKKIRTGDFPAPRKIGKRAVRWLSTDVDSFISDQKAKIE